MTPSPPKILCVDDELPVLEGLSLLLRRRYQVVKAASGAEGLQALRDHSDIAVVISDLRMPQMHGTVFLSKARELAPDVVRILLTGYGDIESAIAAVNDGQLFRFLTKPCPAHELLKAVDAAAEQHRLITAERVLLEGTVHGSVRAMSDVLALTNPVAFGRSLRMKRYVAQLVEKRGEAARWEVEVAAMLSQIGTIALPPATAEKLYYAKPLTADEQLMVQRVPSLIDQLLGSIPRFETIRAIIATYRTASWRPADDRPPDPQRALVAHGAQLLRVAADFDALETELNSARLALDAMLGRTGCYDPELLEALRAIVGGESERREVRKITVAELRVGMVLAEDVRLMSGLLLAGRGYEVKASFVERARNFQEALASRFVLVVIQKDAPALSGPAPVLERDAEPFAS